MVVHSQSICITSSETIRELRRVSAEKCIIKLSAVICSFYLWLVRLLNECVESRLIACSFSEMHSCNGTDVNSVGFGRSAIKFSHNLHMPFLKTQCC